MSRSYKKAICSDQGNASHAKRQANKRVRQSDEVGNGRSYKKHSCSWDICDHKYLSEYEQNQHKDEITHGTFRGAIVTSVDEKLKALNKARRK